MGKKKKNIDYKKFCVKEGIGILGGPYLFQVE
jgi:hypothetical protein